MQQGWRNLVQVFQEQRLLSDVVNEERLMNTSTFFGLSVTHQSIKSAKTTTVVAGGCLAQAPPLRGARCRGIG